MIFIPHYLFIQIPRGALLNCSTCTTFTILGSLQFRGGGATVGSRVERGAQLGGKGLIVFRGRVRMNTTEVSTGWRYVEKHWFSRVKRIHQSTAHTFPVWARSRLPGFLSCYWIMSWITCSVSRLPVLYIYVHHCTWSSDFYTSLVIYTDSQGSAIKLSLYFPGLDSVCRYPAILAINPLTAGVAYIRVFIFY